jgi:hypothetical protein
MAIVVTTDVFCDMCGNWEDGCTGENSIQSEKARKEVAHKGWKRIRVSGKLLDLCPVCANEALKELVVSK